MLVNLSPDASLLSALSTARRSLRQSSTASFEQGSMRDVAEVLPIRRVVGVVTQTGYAVTTKDEARDVFRFTPAVSPTANR